MQSFPPFRLDAVNQCLWRGETRISLMPKPFAVLTYLVGHAGRLVTHDELLAAIWPDTYVQPEVLRRYILEIRRVLGDNAETPRFIQTFPKRGYQFIAPLIAEPAPHLAETPLASSLPPAPPPEPSKPGAKRTRALLAGLVAALLLAAGMTALFSTRSQALRDRGSMLPS